MKIVEDFYWIYYSTEDYIYDEDKTGKWMLFFDKNTDIDQVIHICKSAIEEKAIKNCKHSNPISYDLHPYGDSCVVCFYLCFDDIEAHKRIIQFLQKHNLLKKTDYGRFYDISFKLDKQTKNNEYGNNYISYIRLSNFIDLDTGEWIYNYDKSTSIVGISFDKPSIDKSKYLVLDVETNGLSAKNDDLLSISIYKPDSKMEYNRFLPLDLNSFVLTSDINGINNKDLKKKKHLTQEEFDSLVEEYELDKRIVLTYGNLDEMFICEYCKRHEIKGFEKILFRNFKHSIISSRFSRGAISKDSLCELFGIEGISCVHSGINDCKLEWKLFEIIGERTVFINEDKISFINDGFFIPAHYFSTHTNFRYHVPKIEKSLRFIEEKTFCFSGEKVTKLTAQFNNWLCRSALFELLNAKDNANYNFINRNTTHLKQILKLNYKIYDPYCSISGKYINGYINDSELKTGTDKRYSYLYEKHIEEYKNLLAPVCEYLKNNLLNDDTVWANETVVNGATNTYSVYDLSSRRAVVSVFANNSLDLKKQKHEFYYSSLGLDRDYYILYFDWNDYPNSVKVIISKVKFLNGKNGCEQ